MLLSKDVFCIDDENNIVLEKYYFDPNPSTYFICPNNCDGVVDDEDVVTY